VVLLDDVVEVLRLAQPDVCAGVSAHSLDGRRVGAALVDGDLLRHAVQFDGAFEESSRRSVVSVSTKQKVDRGTGTVDGSVVFVSHKCHASVIRESSVCDPRLRAPNTKP